MENIGYKLFCLDFCVIVDRIVKEFFEGLG